MTLYIIQSTGEMTECSNKEVALQSSNVLVVITHNQKKIFNWIGGQASPHSKFACARETARLRMELGYKIVNLEEEDTTSDFLSAVDEACNISSDSSTAQIHKPIEKPTPVEISKPMPKTEHKPMTETKPIPKSKPKPKPKSKPKPKPKPKPKSKPKPTTETKPKVEKKEPAKKTVASTKKESIAGVKFIFKQLEVLPPLEGKIRDYISIGDSLYIAPENLEDPNKESIVKLPDGSFVADDYLPRLFLENGKIVAIELWREV